jgi:hypothetical protein
MALSIVSSPYKVNATTNNLPIVVTSPSMSMAQYRLVTEIYIPQRGSAPVTTVKTFPSASVAMVDIARVCSQYLTYDNAMEATGSQYSNTNAAYFKVVMGEEYSSSPSSSIISYNGLGQTGSAAFTCSFSGSSDSILLQPAVNEYTNLTYDWPEDQWSEDAPAGNPILTNNPAYQTSSFWTNGNWDNLTGEAFSYDYETVSLIQDGSTNGIQFVEAKVYDENGVLAYSNNTDFFFSQFSPPGPLVHLGIGPANLSASNFPNTVNAHSASYWITPNNWSRITYEIEGVSNNYNIGFTQASCSFYDQTIDGSIPSLQNDFIKGRTRFAFINKLGVMDYYNVVNPVKKTSKITRKNYIKPQLPWQNMNTTSGAVFNSNSRGKNDYYTTYVDNFSVTTDYIDTATSDWLSELIESPSVFIQNEAIVNLPLNASDFYMERQVIPNGFAPINIKNASYTWKTNKFSQKLFQYDLKWEMSNINIGR